MRALVIDNVTKAEVKRVVDFATKPENLYDVTKPILKIPGDDYRYIAQLNTFRCVFTITKGSGGFFRHLSVSVPSKDNPIAVFMIAELFGFTGWDQRSDVPPNDWIAMPAIKPEEHCVVLLQRIK